VCGTPHAGSDRHAIMRRHRAWHPAYACRRCLTEPPCDAMVLSDRCEGSDEQRRCRSHTARPPATNSAPLRQVGTTGCGRSGSVPPRILSACSGVHVARILCTYLLPVVVRPPAPQRPGPRVGDWPPPSRATVRLDRIMWESPRSTRKARRLRMSRASGPMCFVEIS
jgi:hypothetical protein